MDEFLWNQAGQHNISLSHFRRKTERLNWSQPLRFNHTYTYVHRITQQTVKVTSWETIVLLRAYSHVPRFGYAVCRSLLL